MTIFDDRDLAELRALEVSAMPDTVIISVPGPTVADAFGGRTAGTPVLTTTIGLVVSVGQTPQERVIAERASGSVLAAVVVPVGVSVPDTATLTINSTLTMQVVGVVPGGEWATAQKVICKVIS